jgi:hypothetical protein
MLRSEIEKQVQGIFSELFVNTNDDDSTCELAGQKKAAAALVDMFMGLDARCTRLEHILNIHTVKED